MKREPVSPEFVAMAAELNGQTVSEQQREIRRLRRVLAKGGTRAAPADNKVVRLQAMLEHQKRVAKQRAQFESDFDRGVRGFFELLQSTDVCAAAREMERQS